MRKLSLLALTLLAAQVSFAQSTDPTPYCDASFDDVDGTFPVDDHISSVAFGSLLNVSDAQYAAPHYVFYNNLPVQDFTVDSTYPLKITFRVAGGAGYGVWIDYNHNNTFEGSEKVAGTSGSTYLDYSDSTVITQSITIPNTASTGQTRMRVRIVEDDHYHMNNGPVELPCNASDSTTDVMDWGETEDYTINIQPAATGGNTGIGNISRANVLKVLPNPSNGRFLVISGAAINILEVYSIIGKRVFAVSGPGKQVAVDLSGCSKGIYFVRVNSQNRWLTGKLILK
ncbi:MAG TPA: GEVED domain-containing protein [Edaphocola sp.]|nr:GEVED domain-containing protein [Edaphocola sp.]